MKGVLFRKYTNIEEGTNTMTNNSVNATELRKLHTFKKIISIFIYFGLVITTIAFGWKYISLKAADMKLGRIDLFSILIIVIILVLWTPSFIRYIRTPLLSIPRISLYIPKKVLKEHLKTQIFTGVPESNLPDKCFMESEYWYKINGYYVPKYLVYHSYASISQSNDSIYSLELRFLTGDTFDILITYRNIKIDRIINKNTEHLRNKYNFEGGKPRTLAIKTFFDQYLESGNDLMNLITSEENAKQYYNKLSYYLQKN